MIFFTVIGVILIFLFLYHFFPKTSMTFLFANTFGIATGSASASEKDYFLLVFLVILIMFFVGLYKEGNNLKKQSEELKNWF